MKYYVVLATAMLVMVPISGLATAYAAPSDTVVVDSPVQALKEGMPVGETLKYSVTFAGLSGGGMILTTRKHDDDRTCLTIRVRSGGLLGLFYSVDDYMRSCLGVDYEPLGYRIVKRHGGDKDTDVVTYKNGRFSSNGDSGPLRDGTYDMLSMTYALRGLPLKTGHRYSFQAHNGDTTVTAYLTVVGKEKIATYDGYRQAYNL